jgi:hypothetical protein
VDALRVECLHCGQPRWLTPDQHGEDECARCGYVGWAASLELTELDRRRLREHPLEQRRPHAA